MRTSTASTASRTAPTTAPRSRIPAPSRSRSRPVNDPAVVNAGADQTITLPAAATLAGSRHRRRPVHRRCGAKISGPGTVTFGERERPVDDGDVLRLRHLRAVADRQRRPVRQQRHRRDHGESGQRRRPLRRRERLRDVRRRGRAGGAGRDDVHARDVVQARGPGRRPSPPAPVASRRAIPLVTKGAAKPRAATST